MSDTHRPMTSDDPDLNITQAYEFVDLPNRPNRVVARLVMDGADNPEHHARLPRRLRSAAPGPVEDAAS